MKDEAAYLRRELDRIGVRRGRCVRPELRVRVATWLVAQRASGRPISELAAVLGIASGTVIRWSSDTRSRAVVPVRVIAEPESLRVVRVVSPGGFAIEGVALLRQLG